MKRMTARILWAVCIVGTITGGYAKRVTMQAARVTEKVAAKQAAEDEHFAVREASVEIIPGPDEKPEGYERGSVETALKDSVQEVQPNPVREEKRVSLAAQSEGEQQEEEKEHSQSAAFRTEDVQESVWRTEPSGAERGKTNHPTDLASGNQMFLGALYENTVNFVPSRKEEKTETVYVKTVVDADDPATYQTVKKDVLLPAKYVNRAGDVRYEYKDGSWYEYIYGSGDIILDERNEEQALRLLNLDGSYNEYVIMEVKYTAKPGDGGDMEHEYHVRYRRTIKLSSKPEELDDLQRRGLLKVSDTVKVEVEEKVPVFIEKQVGTGSYDYYGWQTLEGDICYFDEEGKKVTGSQVIQGIRHEFDENGIKISRTGVRVSEENGDIDWMSVRGAGVDFAMIRCAYRTPEEGILKTDARAEENIEAAKAAGMETVLFVSSRATTKRDAMEAADFAAMMAERHGLTGCIALMIPEEALETAPDSQTAFAKAFCQVVDSFGFRPVVCADADWLNKNLKMEELDGCLFWISQYDTKITYTGPYEFWLYTDCGSVNGISGYTGLIISHGELGGTSK